MKHQRHDSLRNSTTVTVSWHWVKGLSVSPTHDALSGSLSYEPKGSSEWCHCLMSEYSIWVMAKTSVSISVTISGLAGLRHPPCLMSQSCQLTQLMKYICIQLRLVYYVAQLCQSTNNQVELYQKSWVKLGFRLSVEWVQCFNETQHIR